MKTTLETLREEFAAGSEEPAAEPVVAEPVASEPEPEQRARHEDGRFKPAEGVRVSAPKPKAPSAKPAPATEPAGKLDGVLAVETSASPAASPAEPVEPAAPALKPPADWTAKARAHWDKLPRDVQEESLRLHVETKKTLEERAQLRQATEGWQRRVAPYEPIFRTAGIDPAQGVSEVLGTYAQLVTGAPQVRTKIAAQLIRQYVGVDEASLRAIAAEIQQGAEPQAPQALRPEHVQQMVRQHLEQAQAQQQQQSEVGAIREFEQDAPEFLDKVQAEFVERVKIQKGLGKPITKDLLQHCYTKACKDNDDVSAILKQRDDADKAKANAAEAAKKAAAASGIKTEPAGPTGNGTKRPKSTREQLAQDFAAAKNNRV
jgi:hypothetical protein